MGKPKPAQFFIEGRTFQITYLLYKVFFTHSFTCFEGGTVTLFSLRTIVIVLLHVRVTVTTETYL